MANVLKESCKVGKKKTIEIPQYKYSQACVPFAPQHPSREA